MDKKEVKNVRTGLEVAVIGMAGRFPHAKNLREFWENLKNSVESISFFSDQELQESGVNPGLVQNPDYIKVKAVLEDIEYFDALFFEYTPGEAEIMNPQTRLFHECSWEALENAGYDPGTYPGLIGLYAGASSSFYWEGISLLSGKNEALGHFAAGSLTNKDFLCTTISYKLNLKGPSAFVQTACSTSLVAIHWACRAVLSGECHIALAGGVSVSLPQKNGYLYREGMIISRDGHCRAFDARAKGTIGGNGAGVVVLKRLKNAIADGDHIYAVIKGSAINNDGKRKIGYTAPSVEGQVEALRTAVAMARVEPESISYIETHGTGTILGDPIEIKALKTVFNTGEKGGCAVGSVKTNIGHLDAAAGVAGFIKTVLALIHRQIPPSLHFEIPNPKIDFENSPFYVNTKLREWKNEKYPLRAGISSFGIGGTNAHVVLEEWPNAQSAERKVQGAGSREHQLILFSARTPSALDKMTINLVSHLKENPGINLADAAYTLQTGRKPFKYRRVIVGAAVDEVVDFLSSSMPGNPGMQTPFAAGENIPVVFMFPGQGSQYVDMGLGLYRTEPLFREEMNRCFEILNPLVDYKIKEILYPSSVTSVAKKINQTEITQPVIFAIEYALARLLMARGIVPYAMMGHSIGEYVAACLAGVFSLEDALKLVVLRGWLMQNIPAGSMLGVSLSRDRLTPLLSREISLAAVNSPTHCVVSGPPAVVDDFENRLKQKGYDCRRLHTSHAFHSAMMAPVIAPFEEKVKEIRLHKPQIPYISNVTGNWVAFDQARDPRYWAMHLRQTVRFAEGIETVLKEENPVFVEVGPGKALSTFARQYKGKTVNLVRHPRENLGDDYYLLEKIGRLWLWGVEIHWNKFYSNEKGQRLRIPLPTYPFERQRYSIETPLAALEKNTITGLGHSKGSKRSDMADWFYLPSWKRLDLPFYEDQAGTSHPYNWLVFSHAGEPGLQILQQLKLSETHRQVVIVTPGEQFRKHNDSGFTINPRVPGDYRALFDAMGIPGKKQVPIRILHMWALTPAQPGPGSMKDLDESFALGFYSLLHIARALGKQDNRDNRHKLQMIVVCNQVQEVSGEEEIEPAKAALLGAVGCIPKECPNISCRSIDIELPPPGSAKENDLVKHLKAELYSESPDVNIALRGPYRWVQHFEPVRLDKPGEKNPRLKEEGVYLLTGGLGGIGFVIARYLAEIPGVKLILIGRTAGESWQERKVKELENVGARVLVCPADVSDLQQMKGVFRLALERFGHIDGVIHSAGIGDYSGMILRRTREQSEAVLAPKVKGTLVLDKLLKLKDINPDFFVLCSSLSSLRAPLGQVAYAAANAFLDAFARQRNLKTGALTVAINWDSWQEVGMAVEALERYQSRPLDHPFFDRWLKTGDNEEIFVSYLDVKKHWILDEHRIRGKATLPGTAYLEMAWAAFQHHVGIGNPMPRVEMKDIYILSPLAVEEDEQKEVRTILKQQDNLDGDNVEFSIVSRVLPGQDKWQEHARGMITFIRDESPVSSPIKIAEIETIGAETRPGSNRAGHHPAAAKGLITTGPRWKNLQQMRIGKNQGLVLLELAPDFSEDIESYKLHPALLDNAISFLVGQFAENQAYLPFSFKRIRVNAAMPLKIFSHALYLDKEEPRKKSLEFNITIMDEQGTELLGIEGFILLKVAPQEQKDAEKSPGKAFLEHGIRPGEGVEVFKRILASAYPQVVVCTRDFLWLLDRDRNFKPPVTRESPQPSFPRPQLTTAYAAPLTGTHQVLARLWQEFLGIREIGIYDDFFELGGDSLKALTLLTRIHKTFNVELTLTDIFNSPTISGIAGIIAEAGESIYSSIEPTEKKDYYPLSSAQKRLYFLQKMQTDNVFYNIPQILRLEGKLDRHRLDRAFKALVHRHESLRTSFALRGGQAVQIIHEKEEIDFQVGYIRAGQDEVKEIVQQFVRPFDLEKAPLLRAAVIDQGKENYLWLFDINHIISDATGYAVLLKDLFKLYHYTDENVLPPMPVQYRDFCIWQDRLFKSGRIREQEDYWLNLYADAAEIPRLELPFDYQRPKVSRFTGERYFVKLEKEDKLRFAGLASAVGATLFTNLLAALNVLLFKYTGQGDIIVGSSIAGRPHADLQGIIGMFVNILALRNRINEHMTYREFLENVKHTTLKAFEYQDMQFDKLVEKLNLGLKTSSSRNPLFDVCLNVQNYEQPEYESQELKVLPYEGYKFTASRFDILVWANEVNDEIRFNLEYSTELFKKTTIEKFAQRYIEIIKQVAENHEIQLKDIKISHHLKGSKANMPRMDFGF